MKRFTPIIYVWLFIASCHTPQHFTSYEYRQYAVSDTAADARMEKIIAPYRTQLDAQMSEVIGYCENGMPKVRGQLETELGNFAADLTLKMARQCSTQPIDFCLLNIGGLRNSLPKGNVTRGNIFELMPFENELVVVTLPSSSFRKLLDYLVAWGGQPVAGLRMEIKDGKPVNVSVNGTPVTDADTSSYRVATSDYLLGGGDKMTFLAEGTEKVFLNYKLRDAILDYCMGEYKAGRNLNALLDGRIKNITN